MAIYMNPDAQIVFFAKVFGPNHVVAKQAKALVDAGVTFEVGLYTVGAIFKGKTPAHGLTLTTGSTSLMKHTADPIVAAQNKTLIAGWLNDLSNVAGLSAPVGVPPTPTKVIVTGATEGVNKLTLIKALMEASGKGILDAKKAVEGTKDLTIGTYPTVEAANAVAQKLKALGTNVELIAFPATGTVTEAVAAPQAVAVAKPVDAVIDLKDAAALGQKVHGTSSGSVYYTVAVGEHVKVAARLYKTGSVSLRTEWTDNPKKDLDLLIDSGVSMKSGYGSIHFEAAGVPLSRIVGAFLMGTGIKWKSVVTSGADLVIGESH